MKETTLKVLLVIAAVLAPIKGALITCSVLVFVDLITGMLAARTQGIPISSSGLRRTVVKTVVYQSAIILAFFTEQNLIGPEVPVTKVVTGMIGMTELLSCLENINIISGQNLLKALIDKLGSENK